MFYLDASVVVSALTLEAHTARAQQWLADRAADPHLLSAWTHVEVHAALAAKVRAGKLPPQLRANAVAAYEALRRDQAREVLPGSNHFRRAVLIAADEAAGLRGADALHLAIAAEEGATLCTLDRRQADAARALHLPFVLI
jgi:predicted nucleic acid-binding protein